MYDASTHLAPAWKIEDGEIKESTVTASSVLITNHTIMEKREDRKPDKSETKEQIEEWQKIALVKLDET